MNYLSHARSTPDDPYAVVGTSLPDWLRMLGRQFRIDPERIRVSPDSATPEAQLAWGVRRHFADDRWFHASPAFRHVTSLLTVRMRRTYPEPLGHPRPRHIRASFLAHVLLELLLDGWLIEQDPTSVERYYEALGAIDAARVVDFAEALLLQPAPRLAEVISGFRRYPFLRTYVDDGEVCLRLGQVVKRVRLPDLPPRFDEIVTWSRHVVREHATWLLTGPEASRA